ncbi:MAG: hypothetical protein SFY68_15175 [Candidatus Sumerlaeia bacterium]|nr:hypothetical protein [Candidatus Sumerlaeia bacterium]
MVVLLFLDRNFKVMLLGTVLGIFYGASCYMALVSSTGLGFIMELLFSALISFPFGGGLGFFASLLFCLASHSLSDNFWPLTKTSLTLAIISLVTSYLIDQIGLWFTIVVLNFAVVFYFCFDHGPRE